MNVLGQGYQTGVRGVNETSPIGANFGHEDSRLRARAPIPIALASHLSSNSIIMNGFDGLASPFPCISTAICTTLAACFESGQFPDGPLAYAQCMPSKAPRFGLRGGQSGARSGELAILDQIRARASGSRAVSGVTLGIGDDCALLRPGRSRGEEVAVTTGPLDCW